MQIGENNTVNRDGVASPLFTPVAFKGNRSFDVFDGDGISEVMARAAPYAHQGKCVAWGIPFDVQDALVIYDQPAQLDVAPTKAAWLVFLHCSDIRKDTYNEHGFISPAHGIGKLGEQAADYVFIYEDGTEERVQIRRRHEVGSYNLIWGEQCTKAVTAKKPTPVANLELQPGPMLWGRRQIRNTVREETPWNNYLWAFENPHPEKSLVALRFEPVSGTVVVSGIAAGNVESMPLRWDRRKKAILTFPVGVEFDSSLDAAGNLCQIELDLGQVISVTPRLTYDHTGWIGSQPEKPPARSDTEFLVEFSAHEDALFRFGDGTTQSAAQLSTDAQNKNWALTSVEPAYQRVALRTVDKDSGQPVPVKLHIHGEAGEYLAPVDRDRSPSPNWFEDTNPDHVMGDHISTYISGETLIDLPLGRVYVEVSKGFEVKPVRLILEVSKSITELTIELEKVLHWREQGWVTADTHVHFLSPGTAMLEGAAEGVNVVNLLASQWGELMTNVGDFDGRSTFGCKEAGGDGEYLVRVGTENRQHVLGHISLLGYNGNMISPLCSGGVNESAIGDPVEVLLTEWAIQCRKQGGIVVLPHFPDPRLENAATLVLGEADAVEICEMMNPDRGIDPYSLSDWYRFLNNGYFVAAVGGTDKMSAAQDVGRMRTYAKIPDNTEFTYQSWMDAVRRAETFVTYGPLMEISVEGKPMGQRINLPNSGGTVDIHWMVASVTTPMSKVELIVNGEIRESCSVNQDKDDGQWSLRVEKSGWAALLVRGVNAKGEEIIAAHSSPIAFDVDGSRIMAAADALTILEQIEGAMAYIDTVGTRADDKRYKEMRMLLQSSYDRLHRRMHEAGLDHDHSVATDHSAHKD